MKYDFLKRRDYFEWNEDTPLIIGAILVIVLMVIIFLNPRKEDITAFNNGKTFKCFNDNYYIEVNKFNSEIDNGHIHYIDGNKHYIFPFCKCVIKNDPIEK